MTVRYICSFRLWSCFPEKSWCHNNSLFIQDCFLKLQVPVNKLAVLFDASDDGYDFFVVGLQETPLNFDAKASIHKILGDKYW